MGPKAFLWLAAKLLKDTSSETSEASLGTCVSRSYYALFNLMAQFIRESFPRDLSRTADDHEKVYKYLYNCGVDAVRIVASSLNDLRDQRNDADYKLELDKFEGFSVGLLYKKAGIAIQNFEKAVGNADSRRAIINGISFYKQRTNC